MDLDILFLGKLFPKEKEQEIKAKMKTGMQDAANALQWKIIDGLDANDCGTVKILDYLPVNSYPKGYTDRRIEEYVFQHTPKYKSDDKVVKLNNFTVIKQFVNKRGFKKEVKKWIGNNSGRKKVLLIYTAFPLFLEIAGYVKKHNPEILSVCIIADLPEFICAKKLHGIKKVYNSYQTKKCAKLYKYIDKFVLLTEHMAERLKISAPFMVMEGIAGESVLLPDEKDKINFLDGKQYILYSGTLNFSFGIKTLLDAFALIKNDDIRLVICGFGEAEELIKKQSKTDSRIIYLGRVDRIEALSLQKNAAVLVNPRQNNEEFTKYSFPSKNLEYLSSGVPLIAYKLDGIPDEYDKFYIRPVDDSAKALAECIEKVIGMPREERLAFGKKAQTFVNENKNYIVQTKKILDFISK